MANSITKSANQQGETLPAPAQPAALSPFLSQREMIFIKATFSPILATMPRDKAEFKIMELVNRAYAELGHVPPGSSMEERKKHILGTAQLIINDLNLYYPYVRILEVANAITQGIRREFGDYYGFNVIAVHGFVEKYLELEERRGALERQNRYLDSLQEPEELTPEQIEQIMADGLMNCRDTYLTTGRIIDWGHPNYQQLVDSGKLVLTEEDKKEIYELAELEVRQEHTLQDLSLSKRLYLIKNPPDLKSEIISKCKDIALKRYFDKEKG